MSNGFFCILLNYHAPFRKFPNNTFRSPGKWKKISVLFQRVVFTGPNILPIPERRMIERKVSCHVLKISLHFKCTFCQTRVVISKRTEQRILFLQKISDSICSGRFFDFVIRNTAVVGVGDTVYTGGRIVHCTSQE